MNYLDRIGQRRIEVAGQDMTITLNLKDGISHFGDRVEQLVCDGDTPLRDMHRAILERDGRDTRDFADGIRIMSVIQAIERTGLAGI